MARYRLKLDTPRGWQHLPPGTHVLGRSESCTIVIDSGRASRRHAELVVTEEGATIRDLGSANGTYVSGERITGRRGLVHGDFLVIGDLGLEVSLELESGSDEGTQRTMIDPTEARPYQPPTTRVSSAEILVAAADRCVAGGHPEQAEGVLEGWLARVLSEVEAGAPQREGDVDVAFQQALRLAVALCSKRWVDFALTLATVRAEPLSSNEAGELLAAVGVAGCTPSVFARYTEALKIGKPPAE